MRRARIFEHLAIASTEVLSLAFLYSLSRKREPVVLALESPRRYTLWPMRVVGLDVGTKRVGVALSDELGLTAQPKATISRGSDAEFIDALSVALGDVIPDLVVVGLPLRLDGSEGGSARAARVLATLVGEHYEVATDLWDERFTSIQADRVLKEAGLRRERRRGVTDRVAAAIMLQSYLDAHQERWREKEM